MIKGYEGYFPNQAFFPSVLLPYREKKKLRYSFLGRVDENEHGFQNGGFLTLASYLIKESTSINMEFKETLHKTGDKFSVLIKKIIENKPLVFWIGIGCFNAKNAIIELTASSRSSKQ